MDKCPSSIFNDVIGPVMRGPSSSHVAAAQRIALLVGEAAGGKPQKVICKFDPVGSLAETYHSQGSDIGFAGGLLGMELTDNRIMRSVEEAETQGITLLFEIESYGATHPNDYKVEVFGMEGEHHHMQAISTGGGMIALQKFDGYSLQVCGDYYELLIKYHRDFCKETDMIELVGAFEQWDVCEIENEEIKLLNIKCCHPISPNIHTALSNFAGVAEVTCLSPVLPIGSYKACNVPFKSGEELLKYWTKEGETLELWQLAARYEAARGGLSQTEVFDRMKGLLHIMLGSVKEGLAGTEYEDRILGYQSYMIEKAAAQGKLVPSDVVNNVIRCVTAIMEVKSAMGVIIAAPTAGSCGCLPGTVIGVAMTYGLDEDTMTKGLLAAGVVGAIFAELATFSAEIAGCQVECGAGSGMAAAAVAQMFGATAKQGVNAASVALQNMTGLCCDPVAVRVEVPCLGKNIMGGMNAISCANMILSGYDYVIPLDQTIGAMMDIGLKMPQEIKCTLGGLGKTPASFAIAKRLK